ncbi:glycerophosphodiester phosphodiesterase [Halalkalicoccus jeotgali]|uniref:Glycerophosphoryl diester phosphodiesterase n=1 Tax=Halalkalicoccus jeotgali (strain DSM 18796 / CECT 7217 / JCM 14584 / KCTC 4019 / B3) TaxID=795797 RepID=D8JAC2_HALJB|nr:glycerophosphodiester phosphodiesterase [Halalkalicoccus jeotgali]ADJ14644.1 glycerophosphoryl diester phosphodiesterase [Halalkalicoccus jeotgali B3]ELY39542.1 glycerophosphoryl diester phosphodiesterase [Halalkalicoccus jeotgali B3]
MIPDTDVEAMWAVGPDVASAPPPIPEGTPALIAHRGFAGQYPENTVGAIRAASRTADWIEIDCRPTADGDPAVFHDHRLDRLTDRRGLVAETPSEVVFRTEVLESGASIPRLDRALEAVGPDVGVVLDLKGRFGALSGPDGRSETWDWVASALDTLAGADRRILVSTFWEDALAAVEETADVPTAVLFCEDAAGGLAVARRYGCEAIHPAAHLLTDVGGGAALVDRAHESGMAVNVWSPVTRYEGALLSARGVDGVITDYDDVLRPRRVLPP